MKIAQEGVGIGLVIVGTFLCARGIWRLVKYGKANASALLLLMVSLFIAIVGFLMVITWRDIKHDPPVQSRRYDRIRSLSAMMME